MGDGVVRGNACMGINNSAVTSGDRMEPRTQRRSCQGRMLLISGQGVGSIRQNDREGEVEEGGGSGSQDGNPQSLDAVLSFLSAHEPRRSFEASEEEREKINVQCCARKGEGVKWLVRFCKVCAKKNT